jgi:DNA-directed RNA polymerase subunit RPC12/RpoP
VADFDEQSGLVVISCPNCGFHAMMNPRVFMELLEED